jgi:hypothetical protein
MKKIVVLSFTALLVFGFGTMAFGQAKPAEPTMQFKASGFIDALYNTYINVTDGSGAAGIFDTVPSAFKPVAVGAPENTGFDRSTNYFATRARLKFDWIMGKASSATMLFEMDSTQWGEIAGTGAQRNQMGHWSADRAAVEVKNIYFDFALPPIIPVPITFRVGLQPLAIRPNLLVYTDGMGIISSIKVDPANIQLLYFKPAEGSTFNADDVDVYGGHVNAKIGPVTAGGYALYYHFNQYPFTNLNNDADIWWFGAYADGKMGPVNLNFDFIYDRGTIERKGLSAVRDVKLRGWTTRAKVDFPWEKFNFGVVGNYSSGVDTKKTDSLGLPGNTVAFGGGLAATSTKVGSYVVPVGSEAGAIYGESVVMFSFGANRGTTGIANSNNYTQVSRGGPGGTWLGKAYASFKPTPWYKVTVQGMYIGDTTKNGNTFGTARKPAAVGTALRDDKDIGWEADLINEIQIYKNLSFVIAGGYLWAGDAMDFFRSTVGVTPINESPKNPWMVTTVLTYSF